MKKLLTLSFSLLSHVTSFVVTRPWLSGVTIVCAVLALMMVGYGPQMDWEKQGKLSDDYLYLDEGFTKTDILPTQAAARKIESGEMETAGIIEKHPERSGPRFTGAKQSSSFALNPFLKTAESNQQRDPAFPPTWSQQANNSSGTQLPQRPQQLSKVVSNHLTGQRDVYFLQRKQNLRGPILKTSASRTASSVWLLGTIEDVAELQSKKFKNSSPSFEGPIIQGNR